jgi:hypothetical protein
VADTGVTQEAFGQLRQLAREREAERTLLRVYERVLRVFVRLSSPREDSRHFLSPDFWARQIYEKKAPAPPSACACVRDRGI